MTARDPVWLGRADLGALNDNDLIELIDDYAVAAAADATIYICDHRLHTVQCLDAAALAVVMRQCMTGDDTQHGADMRTLLTEYAAEIAQRERRT